MTRFVTVLISTMLLFGLFSQASAQANYDTLSIYDIRWVPDPATNDQSPRLGDTVVVRGLVLSAPRDMWVGARWSAFIVDPDSQQQPWNSYFIIQNDTTAIGTNMGFLEPGMICNFTGVVAEFSQLGQLAVLTDPLVPIEIVSANNPTPDPVVLDAATLADQGAGEQWESAWATVTGATVLNNNIAGNWASITDASGGTAYMAEYSRTLRDSLNNGTYTWPPNGTSNLEVTGFIRDESGSPGQVLNINPLQSNALTFDDPPPVLNGFANRNIGAPTSSDVVQVSVSASDNVAIASATLHYSVDNGPFQEVPMSLLVLPDTFAADIPAQSNGAFVRYFFSAEDNIGGRSIEPGDTSRTSSTGRVYFYDVRDNGLSIADLQDTRGYGADNSGYEGYEVTVQGIVMTDSTDFVGDYWIQDAAAGWSGIWVNDGSLVPEKGDEVMVTGTVEENFNVTRIDDVTSSSLVTAGVGAYDPVQVTTGELNNTGANNEVYESVLVAVSNVTVTNPFPDAPSNFGEIAFDDGSGEHRADDRASAWRGNLDSLFVQDATIDELRGFQYFSFGNYKLIPRNDMDVSGLVAIGENDQLPQQFTLEQNFPNPFNPKTDIRYTVVEGGQYTLEVFNVLGQQVRVLNNGFHTPGTYQVQWNGRNDNGKLMGSGIYFYRVTGQNLSLTRKMILMK